MTTGVQLLWLVLCLAMTLLWSFVWPRERVTDTLPVAAFVLRWGHASTWGFLAIGALMRWKGGGGRGVPEVLGGLCYAAFLLVFLTTRPR